MVSVGLGVLHNDCTDGAVDAVVQNRVRVEMGVVGLSERTGIRAKKWTKAELVPPQQNSGYEDADQAGG